jgi:CBS domain-containing protein
MKLSHIQHVRDRTIHTARPQDTVLTAAKKLNEHNVGALAILDAAGKLVGIFTERDILHLVARDANISALRVEEVMTRNLVTANWDADVDDAQAVMTEQRIRHLPIVEGGKLAGIISQGDLVKAKLDMAQHEAHQLTNFVLGKYPA